MRWRKKIFFAVFLFSLCISSQSIAETPKIIRGTVIQVSDGDTVVIRLFTGKTFKCRLYGIDAPEAPHEGEAGQPHGLAAERELRNLVLYTIVDVTLMGESSYDREVCVIEKMGADINREMVKRGYAWAYRYHLESPYASEYIGAEEEARKMRRGLWQQTKPTPPWEFRHRSKR